MSDVIDCPALHFRSDDYPAHFLGRVPKTIKMLKCVQPDEPLRSLCAELRNVIAEHSMNYPAYTNSHGAVSAVLDDGRQLGVKPDEFEVIEWHEPGDPR